MKNIVRYSCVIVLFTWALASCTKPAEDVSTAPDISDFSIPSVTPVVAGQASTVAINSVSLGNGTFTVGFDLTGNNTVIGATSVLTMLNNTGTFATPILDTAGETI